MTTIMFVTITHYNNYNNNNDNNNNNNYGCDNNTNSDNIIKIQMLLLNFLFYYEQ